MPTNEELADEISLMKFQIKLLTQLADSRNDPFIYLCLETNLTQAQLDGVLALMDETWKGVKAGKGMDHHEFEQRVYTIVPERNGDYHFAESIVSTLYQDHKYEEVFRYMQKSGMNIHDYGKDKE